MTRKKVKLAFIANDSARKATYKKRKKGLMKKVSELSTLCGIDACAIVYSLYDAQPEVWPDGRGAHRVLTQFKRMPEMEQSKKMVNQETFMRHRIAKAAEQLKKLHKDNREKEVTHLMFHCLTGKALAGLTLPDLNDMGWMIDQNLKEIYKRIEGLKKEAEEQQKTVAAGETGGSGVDRQQQQWFTDWIGMNLAATSGDNPGQIGGCSFGSGSGGDDLLMGFNDANSNHVAAMWSNVFFP